MTNATVPDGYADLRARADEKPPESWKPEKPGDQIAGRVARLDSGYDKDGNEHGIVVLDTGGGTLRSIWLLTEALRNQMMRVSPQPGDRLLVIYRGKAESKSSGRTYHDFKVVTDRQVSTWWDRHKTTRPPAPADGAADNGDLPPVPDEPDFAEPDW